MARVDQVVGLGAGVRMGGLPRPCSLNLRAGDRASQRMTPMEPPTLPEGRCMVRTFIVLPLGLSHGAMSGFITRRSISPRYISIPAMLCKDLDVADFTRYARILSEDIGERSLAKLAISMPASFIESTMGYDNMGYAVQRQA